MSYLTSEFPFCCGLTTIHHLLSKTDWYRHDMYGGTRIFGEDFSDAKRKEIQEEKIKLKEVLKKDLLRAWHAAGGVVALNENQFKYFGDIFDELGFKLIVNGAYAPGHKNRIYLFFKEMYPTLSKIEEVMRPIPFEQAIKDLDKVVKFS